MATKKRPLRAQSGSSTTWDDLTPAQVDALTFWDVGPVDGPFDSQEEAESEYWRHHELILAECHCGQRPRSWWLFEAPKLRAKGVNLAANEHWTEEEKRWHATRQLHAYEWEAAFIRFCAQHDGRGLTPDEAAWVATLDQGAAALQTEWKNTLEGNPGGGRSTEMIDDLRHQIKGDK